MPVFSTALAALDAIAREGSIQRASAVLRLAPSAVLRQIRRLEDEIGAPLLERDRRGSRLTPAGELLVGELRQWEGGLRRVRVAVRAMRGVLEGEVRLGAMDGLVDGVLQDAVLAFHRAHPRIHLSVLVTGSEAGLRALLNRELDLLLAFNLPRRRELRVLGSWSLPFGCVVAPGHPLAGRRELRLEECFAHRILLQDGSIAVRGMLEAHFARLFDLTRPPLATNSIQLIKGVVAAGGALAFLTPLDAAREIASGRVVFVPIRDAGLPRETLSVVEDARRPNLPLVPPVVAALKAAVESHGSAVGTLG